MTRKILAAFVAALIAGPACATDLPMARPMPVKARPIVQSSWAGWYVGPHVGYGWDPADATFNPAAYGTALVPTLVVTAATAPFGLAVEPKGWLGGIQLGRNRQTGQWV